MDSVLSIMASTALFNSGSFAEASVKTKMSDDGGALVNAIWRGMNINKAAISFNNFQSCFFINIKVPPRCCMHNFRMFYLLSIF